MNALIMQMPRNTKMTTSIVETHTNYFNLNVHVRYQRDPEQDFSKYCWASLALGPFPWDGTFRLRAVAQHRSLGNCRLETFASEQFEISGLVRFAWEPSLDSLSFASFGWALSLGLFAWEL